MSNYDREPKGTFTKDSSIYSLYHGTNAYLLEDELNESQWNQIERFASIVRMQYSSGLMSEVNINLDSAGFFVESLDGNPLSFLINGYELKVGHNLVDQHNLSQSNRLIVPLSSSVSEERYDLVYLEAWFEVVNYSETIRKYGGDTTPTIPNNFLDNRLGLETARRIQLKWRLVVRENTENLNGVFANKYDGSPSSSVFQSLENIFISYTGKQTTDGEILKSDGIVYGIPLFKIKRTPNVELTIEDIVQEIPKSNMFLGNTEIVVKNIKIGNELIVGDNNLIVNNDIFNYNNKLTINGDTLNFNGTEANFTNSDAYFKTINTTGNSKIGGNLVIDGDLFVNGTTTTLNTGELYIEDNIITLNSNVTGTPLLNAGIEIERGTLNNVQFRWNEALDQWEVTENGVNYYKIWHAGNLTENDLNFVKKTGDTMNGALSINSGSNALSLKAGTTQNHVFLSLYADSAAQNTRSGFVGYGSTGITELSVKNERSNGIIALRTTGTTASIQLYSPETIVNGVLNTNVTGGAAVIPVGTNRYAPA